MKRRSKRVAQVDFELDEGDGHGAGAGGGLSFFRENLG